MSDGIEIKGVTGLKELAARLQALPTQLQAAIAKPILKDVAEQWRAECEARAPIGPTGSLRNSFKKSVRVKRRESIQMKVFSTAPHAHLVEYGHKMVLWGHRTDRRVPAHPFMRPALEAVAEKTTSEVAEALADALRQIGLR